MTDNRQKSKDLLFEKLDLLSIPIKKRTKEQIKRISDIQFELDELARPECPLPISEDLDQQTQDALDVFDGEIKE